MTNSPVMKHRDAREAGHPRDAGLRAALLLLELAAALLTLLAFRAVLLGTPSATIELFCAAVLAAACGLPGRE